jgi:hypothetical protein
MFVVELAGTLIFSGAYIEQLLYSKRDQIQSLKRLAVSTLLVAFLRE